MNCKQTEGFTGQEIGSSLANISEFSNPKKIANSKIDLHQILVYRLQARSLIRDYSLFNHRQKQKEWEDGRVLHGENHLGDNCTAGLRTH